MSPFDTLPDPFAGEPGAHPAPAADQEAFDTLHDPSAGALETATGGAPSSQRTPALDDPRAKGFGALATHLAELALAQAPSRPGRLTTHAIPHPAPQPEAPLAEPRFRRALLALLAADWAVYPGPFDRVEFARLAAVVTRFPRGFRVAFWTPEGGDPIPVGYTGYYPVGPREVARFRAVDPSLLDRSLVPLCETTEGGALYLFSYGLTPAFRRAPFSRAVLREYEAAFRREEPAALLALCVSGKGLDVAGRWGISSRGVLVGPGGEHEHVCLWEGGPARS